VDDLEKAKTAAVEREKKVDSKVLQLENKCDRLEKKVTQLEEQILKGEIKDRYNNLIFHGIKEKGYGPKEDSKDVIETLIKEKLEIEFDLVIRKCYRMGSHQKAIQTQARPRPIFVEFSSAREKELVWKMKLKLKGDPTFIAADYPRKVEERRAKLLPIFKMAKSMTDYSEAHSSMRTSCLLTARCTGCIISKTCLRTWNRRTRAPRGMEMSLYSTLKTAPFRIITWRHPSTSREKGIYAMSNITFQGRRMHMVMTRHYGG
jgi:hypothetical protein